jgi:hypothetical protein
MNVIICGVVKNAAANLDNNLKLAMQLGAMCTKYKIVIYENNSSDATKQILGNYGTDEHFEIIMEDIDNAVIKRDSKIWAYTAVTGSDHPCRIEQISNARNKLIAEIKDTTKYADYNYVVMIDFDAKFFLPEGIMHSLHLIKENRKRVVYANSLDYYDYYALRSAHSEYNLFGPELMGEFFWQKMNAKRLKINPESNELVPVYSAFNGIGVYDKDVFTAFQYDALITPATKAVYKQIADLHPNAYALLKPILQNECSKFYGGERTPEFYWKNNSGYDKPVICEHVAFNFALFQAGYEIVINPRMLYWWN